jgi:hypothetical protein
MWFYYMFFRYTYTDPIDMWLYYVNTIPEDSYPLTSVPQNDHQTVCHPGTIYNIYMYSVVLNLTKFLLGFFSSFFYSKSRDLSYQWRFRKLLCSFIILFIYNALVFIATLFEFAVFSLIISYLVYSIETIMGYEQDSYTEYLAWEVKEHWRLVLIILFVLHEENRWTNVKREFWEDLSFDVNYYYENRNAPKEEFYGICSEVHNSLSELNKNKTLTVVLIYMIIFTLYYNQYVDFTTTRLFSNDILDA